MRQARQGFWLLMCPGVCLNRRNSWWKTSIVLHPTPDGTPDRTTRLYLNDAGHSDLLAFLGAGSRWFKSSRPDQVVSPQILRAARPRKDPLRWLVATGVVACLLGLAILYPECHSQARDVVADPVVVGSEQRGAILFVLGRNYDPCYFVLGDHYTGGFFVIRWKSGRWSEPTAIRREDRDIIIAEEKAAGGRVAVVDRAHDEPWIERHKISARLVIIIVGEGASDRAETVIACERKGASTSLLRAGFRHPQLTPFPILDW